MSGRAGAVATPGAPPGPPAPAAVAKEKRPSFSKRLLFRGGGGGGGSSGGSAAGARSLGGFMSRVLKTLSTLSHLGSEHGGPPHPTGSPHPTAAASSSSPSALGRCFQPSPEPEPPAPPAPPVVEPPAPCPTPNPPPPPPPPPPFSSSSAAPSFAVPGVPGVSGLRNHGNTCFMNAVLQCLSNTELFAEFLALEQFRGAGGDRDRDQEASEAAAATTITTGAAAASSCPLPPIASSSSSACWGEVTEQLAHLVRALWTLEYTPQHSRDFKSIVSKNALQYRGSSQHDAQEFLLWLLDRVHEDLHNMVKNSGRPSFKPPLEDDALMEGAAFPINSTFVQELFQAQYRSSLTCPHCQKQSNTFDPFLCISLPIPLPHTRLLYVTVVYRGKCSHCMRIGVAVPLSGTVARLREAVSRETKIPTKQIALTEMYYDGFHRSFSDLDDLDAVQESDSLFAFETPEVSHPEGTLSPRGIIQVNSNLNHLKCALERQRASPYSQGLLDNASARVPLPATPASPSPSSSSSSDKIVVLVCNRACSGQQGKRFGQPFVLHLEKTIPWDLLQKEILGKMQNYLRPSACLQVCPFSLRVVTAVGITYLLPQEERPLCHLMVERALKSCGQGGAPHVKLVVEWDKETKDYLFVSVEEEEEYVPDAESVRQQRELHHQPQNCTLAHCFQLYTKEEQLAPDDAWRCPHCKQLQQGSITLSLWTLPDVLIIHLKRFRQEGDRRVKLQNLVKFPLAGLDMTPHVVKRSQSSWSLPSHWSPWRRPYGLGRDPEDFVYDLYAVCNHHGTMQGGHYTAFCKNSVDGLWYCFDDSDVQPLPENEVCKQTAYILFYQRRTAIPSWSANSSLAGSTSSSLCEHWVSRLPGSKQPSIASAASSRRTSLASLSESVEMMGEKSEDDGGFSTRPFVRSVQRQSLSSRSSVTSPLAVSENGLRPSWPLSAKLQMRSNSPSRFSGDSPVHGAASTLERIGESVDDKTSTSCFSGLRGLSGSYPEPAGGQMVGRAPLAVMEGAFRDETPARRSGLAGDSHGGKVGSQAGKSIGPALDPLDNNNQIAFVDQSDSVESSPVKEERGFGRAPLSPVKTAPKGAPTKDPMEPDRSLRKGRAPLSSQDSMTSRPAGPPKGSRSRSKLESGRSSGRHGSPAASRQGKKEAGPKGHEASGPLPAQQRQKSFSSSSSSTTRRNPLTSSGGRSRTSEQSLSREGSKQSLGSDKTSATTTTTTTTASSRTGSPRSGQPRGEGRTLESKQMRSNSLASLRSPPATGPHRPSLKRDSKSDEKGLSFFKSALRQKETRRSADLGKTSLLSRKAASGASARAAGKSQASEEKKQQTPDNCSSKTPGQRGHHGASPTIKDSTASPAKHALLPGRKSKSSPLGAALPSSGSGKPPSSLLPTPPARPSSKSQ